MRLQKEELFLVTRVYMDIEVGVLLRESQFSTLHSKWVFWFLLTDLVFLGVVGKELEDVATLAWVHNDSACEDMEL